MLGFVFYRVHIYIAEEVLSEYILKILHMSDTELGRKHHEVYYTSCISSISMSKFSNLFLSSNFLTLLAEVECKFDRGKGCPNQLDLHLRSEIIS